MLIFGYARWSNASRFDFDDPMLLMKSWERKATAPQAEMSPPWQKQHQGCVQVQTKTQHEVCFGVGGVASYIVLWDIKKIIYIKQTNN